MFHLNNYDYGKESCSFSSESGKWLWIIPIFGSVFREWHFIDALVFSCGDAVPVFQQNADKPYNVDLMQVIKTFGAKGKMMIGHCAGAMMFDFTGITKGKKVAVHPLAKPAIQNGTATDKKSEIDGNFFTAQDENTIWTMMPQVIEALK